MAASGQDIEVDARPAGRRRARPRVPATRAIRATQPGLSKNVIGKLTAITLRRQQVIRDHGRELHVILDESALLRQIADPARPEASRDLANPPVPVSREEDRVFAVSTTRGLSSGHTKMLRPFGYQFGYQSTAQSDHQSSDLRPNRDSNAGPTA